MPTIFSCVVFTGLALAMKKAATFLLIIFSSFLRAEVDSETQCLDKIKAMSEQIILGNLEKLSSIIFDDPAIKNYISEQTIKEFDSALKVNFEAAGPCYSYQHFATAATVASLQSVFFLYRCERQPVVMYFSLYNPSGDWRINSARFSYSTEDILEGLNPYNSANNDNKSLIQLKLY